MSVKQRLIDYLKEKHIKGVTFTSEIGVSKGYIGAISKSIGNDVLNSISIHYPDLNIEWLLTGDGDMLKQNRRNEEKIAGKDSESDSNGVGEPTPGYGSKRGGEVSIPREILELLNMQAETIRSQQRTIEKLEAENKKTSARQADNAGFADVG